MERTQRRVDFRAIIEVAALFVGIFICMQPGLQILGIKESEPPRPTSSGLRQPAERARQRPNFMVRAIAESSGVKMPSFFGYMIYSFLILLPILALTVWLFLT